MNKPKVLYLHHAKDFSSNPVYLSDDFLLANKSLFGAQEMDSWAGYRILARDFLVYRLQISTNLSAIQFIAPNGQLLKSIKIDIPSGLRAKMSGQYIKTLVRFLDTSFAIYSDPILLESVEEFVNDFDISFIWSDTQFYAPFIPSQSQVLIRSVNFEPLHVLREDPTPLRILRAAGKVWSESKTLRENRVTAISPRDAYYYSKLGNRKVNYLPLRQLGFLLEQSPDWDRSSNISCQPFVYFAGSNFDVKHNRDNLINVIESVSPALASLNPDILILIFGHRFPNNLRIPFNVKHMFFRDDFHALTSSALASLVPNRGGAGMQSKVFEPLCRGIPLIANSAAFSDYPFTTSDHYWNGNTVENIIQSIKCIMERPKEALQKASAAKDQSLSLFNFRRLQLLMNELVLT